MKLPNPVEAATLVQDSDLAQEISNVVSDIEDEKQAEYGYLRIDFLFKYQNQLQLRLGI